MPSCVTHNAIVEEYLRTGCKTTTANNLGCARSTVIRHTSELSSESRKEGECEFTVSNNGDTATVKADLDFEIRNEEDAIKAARIDTKTWRVKKWWTSFRGTRWRVSLELERIALKPIDLAADAIIERMKAHSPRFPAIKRKKIKDPHLLVIDLFDVHFGKLCWKPETGNNYDLKIAETVYRNAVEDLMDKVHGFPIEQIVLPIGNDYFHIDNFTNSTTNLTPQDVDGRYQKIYEVGFMAKIWAIELMLSVAPVFIPWVPGNHDKANSWHLTRELGTYFRHCKDLHPDYSAATIKYHRWAKTLIGFQHGNGIKADKLVGIMANQRKKDWYETDCHEWHRGHFHTSGVVNTTPVETRDGVTIRQLASLSATDAWHYNNGYIGSPRAAECYLYSAEYGFSGHFNANARES